MKTSLEDFLSDMHLVLSGAELEPFDFQRAHDELVRKYGSFYKIRDVDVMSYVMYPKVFEEVK